MTSIARQTLIAMCFLSSLGLLLSSAHAETPSKKPPISVIVSQVSLESKAQSLDVLGTLKAAQAIEIRPNVTEKLSKILVKDGQTVEQGQLLFELNDAEEFALLKQAQIQANEAKRQFERAKRLRGQGNITEAVIDEKQALWESANAEVEVIQTQLADRQIFAPFAGQIGLINVSRGDLVTVNTILTTLDDTSSLRVDFQIPSQYQNALYLGQTIQIYPPAPATMSRVYESSQTPTNAKVMAISPRVNAQTLLLPVRARIDQPQSLKSGMIVKSQIALKAAPKLWIPNSALLMVGEKKYAYRLKDAHAEVTGAEYAVEKREISIGQRLSQFTEVLSGLQANDLIVSQGVLRLSPKSTVVIKAIEGETADDQLLKPAAKRTDKVDKAEKTE